MTGKLALEHTKPVWRWVTKNGCVHTSHIDNDGVWWRSKIVWDKDEQGLPIRMSQGRRKIPIPITNHFYRNTMRTCYGHQTRCSRDRGFNLKWMNWKSCCRNWVNQIKLRVIWIRWMTLSIWLRGVLLSWSSKQVWRYSCQNGYKNPNTHSKLI